ncbi:MAG: hypothetical protein GEV03_19635 [Streptosporangiales bacterium]|nr:hypothetical protein [Streptosporangiales bacterium]
MLMRARSRVVLAVVAGLVGVGVGLDAKDGSWQRGKGVLDLDLKPLADELTAGTDLVVDHAEDRDTLVATDPIRSSAPTPARTTSW